MNALKKQVLLGMAVLSLAAGSVYADDSAPKNAQDWQAKRGEMMQKRMEEHWTKFHDALKLSATQEPAWQTFRAATTPPKRDKAEWAEHQHEGKGASAEHKDMPKLSTPEQLDKMLAMMKKHEQEMETHVAAVKTFYNQLSAEQKQTFDEHFHHIMQHRSFDRRGGGRGFEH